MIKGATLKVYKGAPHGLMTTHQEQFNNDLLEFARQQPEAAASVRRTAVREMTEVAREVSR
jgi:non-heme chloroperoxidase